MTLAGQLGPYTVFFMCFKTSADLLHTPDHSSVDHNFSAERFRDSRWDIVYCLISQFELPGYRGFLVTIPVLHLHRLDEELFRKRIFKIVKILIV